MPIPDPIYHKGSLVLEINQAVSIGSHIQAGARAELIDSPLTRALSSVRGRMLAQTMRYLFKGNIQPVLNYAAIRPYAVMEAIRIALSDRPRGKRVLDPATGYTPIFYWLAEEFPDTYFVEIDTHEVIEHKRSAYHPYGIPSNLRLRPIDLHRQRFHDVHSEKVDVMIGLAAYVSHADYREFLTYLSYIIRDDGYLIATFPYKPGIDHFTQNSILFGSMVSTPKGFINNITDLDTVFKGTGYVVQDTIVLSELARAQNKPIPADIEIIAIVRREF